MPQYELTPDERVMVWRLTVDALLQGLVNDLQIDDTFIRLECETLEDTLREDPDVSAVRSEALVSAFARELRNRLPRR